MADLEYPMREIHLTYTITEADLSEARRNAKFPRSIEDGAGSFLLLVLVITLLYATPALWDWLSANDHRESAARQIVVGGAPWVYVIAWLVLVTKRQRKAQTRAIYESTPGFKLEHNLCLNDEGLSIESAGGSARYKWCSLVAFHETTHLLLLFQSSASFLMLPKRALPADTDLALLRQEIGDRINSFCLPPDEWAKQRALPDAPALFPRLHFTLLQTEYFSACHSDRRTQRRQIGRDMFIIIPIYAVVLWIALGTGLSGNAFGWTMAGFLFATVAILFVLQTRRWRRATHLHGPQTIDITEAGLRFGTPKGVQWIGWGAIERHRRAGKVFAIFLRDGTMRCIPERAFLTPESAAQFAALIRSRITPTVGFPVVVNAPH